MDAVEECYQSAHKGLRPSLEAAEELINLEAHIARARKEVSRKCPPMGVSLTIEGEKPLTFHLNVFEVVKLKHTLDHQQWRTDNPFR